MKTICCIVLALFIGSDAYATSASPQSTCFFKSEYVSGMNRICVYSCISGDAAITVGAAHLCPLTIDR